MAPGARITRTDLNHPPPAGLVAEEEAGTRTEFPRRQPASTCSIIAATEARFKAGVGLAATSRPT
jgi:hypothetical protein